MEKRRPGVLVSFVVDERVGLGPPLRMKLTYLQSWKELNAREQPNAERVQHFAFEAG